MPAYFEPFRIKAVEPLPLPTRAERAAALERAGYNVHQGRAAERILFSCLLAPGSISVANTHFDTTRANVELFGATALDFPWRESIDLSNEAPFKGNLDLDRLDHLLGSDDGARMACVVMTLSMSPKH
jgi:tryptophanase